MDMVRNFYWAFEAFNTLISSRLLGITLVQPYDVLLWKRQNNYGRNRQSIADLEQELYDVFADHPQSTINDNNEPVIAGHALVDVLRAFSRNHDSELMTKEEEEQLKTLLAGNPGLAVTPQVLLQFIAMRTTVSPRHSPEGSPPEDHATLSDRSPDEADDDYSSRGSHSRSHSRSSSRDSTGTSRYRPPSRPPSRGPAVPPKTPTSASVDSPFDNSRRQRSTPLETGAPSSWSRRPPPSRRKSDAGRNSDSEVSLLLRAYTLPFTSYVYDACVRQCHIARHFFMQLAAGHNMSTTCSAFHPSPHLFVLL